jgi:hypothetical protein
MAEARGFLARSDKDYMFLHEYEYEEKDIDTICSLWTEGNYGCDCNKSIFIDKYCDKNFPRLKCGNTVMLVSLKHVNVSTATVPLDVNEE